MLLFIEDIVFDFDLRIKHEFMLPTPNYRKGSVLKMGVSGKDV